MKTVPWRWPCLILLAGMMGAAISRPALGQLTQSEEERLQILSDPDALKKKFEKDKSRAPFEFFRSQVAPFDVLPYIKPYQWSTVFLDVRSNYQDYEGSLQFIPVALPGMPEEVIYARESRLTKEQRMRLGMQVMLPRFPREKELNVELAQPGAVRYDELWQVPLRLLPPHQMLVIVLTKDTSTQYATWNRLPACIPAAADRDDPMALDLQRYYRLVLPEDPDKAFLSPHPLTWATISHIIWDGFPPESLSVSNQQSMLDWLHWGGQLVLIGGAGPSYSMFRESFLGNYLPAEPTGENALLGEAELGPLSQTYPPSALQAAAPDQDQGGGDRRPLPQQPRRESVVIPGQLYHRAVPIQPPKNRPIFVTGLRPNPGATTVTLGQGSRHLLAVESRVGRGRITMLTINPTDPALVAWPGLDTLIRRVILRRPEDPGAGVASNFSGMGTPPAPQLESADLSWYRITSRDSGVAADVRDQNQKARAAIAARQAQPQFRPYSATSPLAQPLNQGSAMASIEEAVLNRRGVAEWRDSATVPRLCRDALEKASGITVPSSQFVLKVILAYVLAVVPLNWLICRLLLKRREWAWIVVPVLALGFAIGVERAAAYDMGYDSACDEIDLLEVQGIYTRGHLSRFAALYTTGRTKYTIAYPNESSALALPYNSERSIGGEDVSTAYWQSYPVPALQSFAVQPRSLAMYRGEQMLGLGGPIVVEEKASQKSVVNHSEFDLRDAVLVDFPGNGERRETYLGKIAAGGSVAIDEKKADAVPGEIEGFDGPDPTSLLETLRRTWENQPEDAGEMRLVAWIPQPISGQTFEPALDRHRGVTAVTVHLRYGGPPSPHGPRYDARPRLQGEKASFLDRPEQPRSGWIPVGDEGRRQSYTKRAGA